MGIWLVAGDQHRSGWRFSPISVKFWPSMTFFMYSLMISPASSSSISSSWSKRDVKAKHQNFWANQKESLPCQKHTHIHTWGWLPLRGPILDIKIDMSKKTSRLIWAEICLVLSYLALFGRIYFSIKNQPRLFICCLYTLLKSMVSDQLWPLLVKPTFCKTEWTLLSHVICQKIESITTYNIIFRKNEFKVLV